MRRPVSLVADPNVIPMIDILLVLLVIFMVGAMNLVRRAFDLQLPAVSAESAPGSAIVLKVAPGPAYELNGRHLPSSDLEAELRTVFERRNERVLHISGDRRLRYHEVVRVFDATRGAGVTVTAIVPGRL